LSQNQPSNYSTTPPRAIRRRQRHNYRLPALVAASLAICALLYPYLTHPGLHVAGATVLLDVLLVQRWYKEQRKNTLSRTTRYTLLSLLITCSILGLTAVLMENDDPFAMTLTTLEGCLSVLLLLL